MEDKLEWVLRELRKVDAVAQLMIESSNHGSIPDLGALISDRITQCQQSITEVLKELINAK